MVFQARERSHSLTGDRHALPMGGLHAQVFVGNIITINIIIITRPKPPYGRQGLAGSLGQGYSQAGTFWCVLNVSLHALAVSLDWILLIAARPSGIVGPGNSSSGYNLECSQLLQKMQIVAWRKISILMQKFKSRWRHAVFLQYM